ncbi:hypothetical protein NA56DRAFT_663535 [Hyaloscypha hepaticicola]|uniref:Rhodopsin domain-containing protein n=1 Tax=Hyaloscypha hepaticicola TaxID=2082293 RepID=A0A2J6PP29_9HELO|nr:hypothetical protein NA56DRAFT_663535 [Hyaloscypha hepaticicola]
MYVSIPTVESWPTPNYINPQTRGDSVLIIHGTLYSLVVVVVGLRVYTRMCISRSFGLDDMFILLAMIPTTAFVVIMLVALLKFGWNRHAWDVLPSTVAIGEKFSLTSQILFAAASICTRLSMLFLTRRILASGYARLQSIINFAIVWMSTGFLVFILVVTFQCKPISAYWTLSFVPQHCINERVHLVIEGTFNIIYDFVTVLIPIPIVMRLNLPLRQRIIVALLFGMGIVVCFAGVVRTYYMYRVTDGYHDVTWDAYPVWFGTAIELYLGIVCTSAPPTKPFFARYLPKLLSSTNRSQNFTFSSTSQSNTFNPIHSFASRDREASAGIEFDQLSGKSGDLKMKGEIHKTVEVMVEQSWLDTSRTPGGSSSASAVKLVH